MSGKDRNIAAEAACAVHRQIRKAENARQMGRLPGLRLPTEMPERLAELLRELRQAERGNSL